MEASKFISIIIPTYNGAARIGNCLSALQAEARGRAVEVIVVNDGSTDGTTEVVGGFPGVRVLRQSNAGPAMARNRGAQAARGEIIIFTDDDCVPADGWLAALLEPFADETVVGAKGRYLTRQSGLIARFVQLDYEDRYRITARSADIDFIDTYSAAFRRAPFLELNGYDTSFPVACAEDAELSFRMSARGWRMRFAPNAAVYHQHPNSLMAFLKKKFKFAFWRVIAVSKNPSKVIRDSHTPQIMKLQLLFLPALVMSALADFCVGHFRFTALALLLFLLSALPFTYRAIAKDPLAGLCSPVLLALRSFAQLLGVVSGVASISVNHQFLPVAGPEAEHGDEHAARH